MFCLFHLDEIYIILSKAAGGIYGDVNCVGIEASDKNVGSRLWICYASLFAEWHMVQEVN